MKDRRQPVQAHIERMAALEYVQLMFRLGVRVMPGVAPAKVEP